jgi:predicted RNase H-like nuclease (RuvC/YqgF family)
MATTARRVRNASARRQRPAAASTLADAELAPLRSEIQRVAQRVPRLNAAPEDVQRSVMQLVLTLVEFVRSLLERQAIRRMEARSLTAAQIEELGRALMILEQTVDDLARRFDLELRDLNLDLGPLGKLM